MFEQESKPFRAVLLLPKQEFPYSHDEHSAWCLWCLFGLEIGATHAEQLKQLQNARSWKSPMFMRVSRILLKT